MQHNSDFIGLVGRVFTNDLGDQGSILVEPYQRLKKIVLDTSLLNTQYYKVCIKSQVEQSRERSSTQPYYLCVVAIEKGPFGLPLIAVANFTYIIPFPPQKKKKKLARNNFET